MKRIWVVSEEKPVWFPLLEARGYAAAHLHSADMRDVSRHASPDVIIADWTCADHVSDTLQKLLTLRALFLNTPVIHIQPKLLALPANSRKGGKNYLLDSPVSFVFLLKAVDLLALSATGTQPSQFRAQIAG